jgi:DNA oxidative demethylase
MLFESQPQQLEPDFWILPGFYKGEPLLEEIRAVIACAPLRHLVVPGGRSMAVAMSNCGSVGWTSDIKGYRYTSTDPLSDLPWPDMPALFLRIAQSAADRVGWPNFQPDCCLINQYAPGAGLGLHQDRDELDHTQPIVSISIGEPCKFILGGLKRNDPVRSVPLQDGDVMVWGGQSRLRFHGVRPLAKPAGSSLTFRYNLTFRKAV